MRHCLAAVAALIAGLSVVGPPAARAQGAPDQALSDVMLPGGLAAARDVLRERTSADRALFLPELIHRFYNTPRQTSHNEDQQLQSFLTYLERASLDPGAASDSVPLPLTVPWWIDVVFAGRAAPGTLLLEILRSRDAALLYRALLALDGPTRLWIAGERHVVGRLLHGRAALLVHAAPGVRVSGGRFVVPGGERCREAWERLVGASTKTADEFLLGVLDQDDGALAYFVGRMSRLPDASIEAIVHAEAAHATPFESLRRLYRAFRRAGRGWNVAARPFSSMPDDPARLLAHLARDGEGRMLVPGNEPFWLSVFEAGDDPAGVSLAPGASVASGLVDVAWLLDQVVRGDGVESRRRADQVLFASRALTGRVHANAADAAVTLVALASYPALVRTLERMGIDDGAVFRAAVDRAGLLHAIADPAARARSTAQYQGTLALVAGAARRGTLQRDALAGTLISLSAVSTSEAGEYEGRIAAWIDAHLRRDLPRAPLTGAAGPADVASRSALAPDGVDADLAALLAAFPAGRSESFEWEGTRYRLDLGFAEARRLERIRSDSPRDLPAAWMLLELSERFASGVVQEPDLAQQAARFEQATVEFDPFDGEEERTGERRTGLVTDISRAFAAARKARTTASVRALADSIRLLADELLAGGLIELAYAAALGGADSIPITAAEAASRHDLGIGRSDEALGIVAWRLPVPSVRARGPWHVEGALLGLDVCLAESWLRRTSTRPLPVPPSMDRADRRVLSEVVTTMDPATLTDADRDAIAEYLRTGRARLASAASVEALDAVAAAASVDPVRRNLLPWVFTRVRDRVPSYLSLAELLRLGVGARTAGRYDAWGAPGRPLLGCLCLQLPDRPADTYMGHLSSGITMGALPDLNLRLAELLAELHLPAALLPSLLAGATLDLIDRAPSRYPDDLRGIVEYASRVSIDDVERYLALLTVDGPLVPDDRTARDAARGAQ